LPIGIHKMGYMNGRAEPPLFKSLIAHKRVLIGVFC